MNEGSGYVRGGAVSHAPCVQSVGVREELLQKTPKQQHCMAGGTVSSMTLFSFPHFPTTVPPLSIHKEPDEIGSPAQEAALVTGTLPPDSPAMDSDPFSSQNDLRSL
ncbi:unnamed protein product [Leuciscus chuanchicus]